jgi:hypothetical protein
MKKYRFIVPEPRKTDFEIVLHATTGMNQVVQRPELIVIFVIGFRDKTKKRDPANGNSHKRELPFDVPFACIL